MHAGIHRDTERQILDAAEELFLEKGFALASTTMIAKKAGCTQALIHYYFRTKDKLIEAVFRKYIAIFFSSFTQIDQESERFEERVKRKIETHFDILAAHPRLPFLIINELAANPERAPLLRELVRDVPKKVYKRFAADLAAEIAAGRVRPMTPLDLGITLVSLNAMLFLAKPILTNIFRLDDKAFRALARQRKAEHVTIILRSLQP